MTAHAPILFRRQFAPLFALVRAALLWPVKVHSNRQLLHRMSAMSAIDLADIGLCRQDLRDSAALPLTSEIGAFLATRASERRRLRQGPSR